MQTSQGTEQHHNRSAMKRFHSWETGRPLASKEVSYAGDWIILIVIILFMVFGQ